ncbi:hypothetical protein [Rhizobium azibense]|uniref:hypothetical protein n=1 Tax=Rhizobium azibense TaxID=1136135 RepID=UPI001047C679|nr:hypothetical protein [Rhizobium azibense]
MNVFQAANPNRNSGGLLRFGSGRLAIPPMILNGVFAASAKIVDVLTNRPVPISIVPNAYCRTVRLAKPASAYRTKAVMARIGYHRINMPSYETTLRVRRWGQHQVHGCRVAHSTSERNPTLKVA